MSLRKSTVAERASVGTRVANPPVMVCSRSTRHAAANRLASRRDDSASLPTNDDLCDASISALLRGFAQRSFSPRDAIDAMIGRIERLDSRLRAYCFVDAGLVRRAADEAHHRYARGEARALEGVPVSVKDLLDVAGMPTSRGSYSIVTPTEDSPAVRALRAAGAIIVGKTNTSELGWSGSCANKRFGSTKNPFDLARTSGGSSGGAAAALAAGMCTASIGSDAAGSVRIPASYCAVVGLKPTRGRLPHRAVTPSLRELATVGPLSRNVQDLRILFNHLAEPPLPPRDARAALPSSVCFASSLFATGASHPLAAAAAGRVLTLRSRGIEVVSLPSLSLPRELEQGFRSLFAVAQAELEDATSFGDREKDEGRLTLARLGRTIDRPDVGALLALARRAVDDVLRDHALILTPVTIAPPFLADHPGPEGHAIPDWMVQTALFNMSGHPAVSVPCGLDEAGLPFGLQVIAPHWGEEDLFVFCDDWLSRNPPRLPGMTTFASEGVAS